MNYYDELGLPLTATTEEIREAYRRMARLLHPDQQHSEDMRKLAEIQMKRLNTIALVLTDAEQRRRYDQSLRQESMPPPPPLPAGPPPPGAIRAAAPGGHRDRTLVFTPPPRPPRDRVPLSSIFGKVIWVVSVLIALGSVAWYFATDNSFPQQPVRPRFNSGEPPPPAQPVFGAAAGAAPETRGTAQGAEPRATAETAGGASAAAAATIPANRENPLAPARQPRQIPVRPVAASAQPPAASYQGQAAQQNLPAAAGEAAGLVTKDPPTGEAAGGAATEYRPAAPTSTRTEAAQAGADGSSPVRKATQAASLPPGRPVAPPAAAQPGSIYAGNWFFPRPKTPPSSKDLFPPEYIELAVTEEGGRLRGSYRARYRIPNRPIRPDISFRFDGPVTQDSPARFWWTGAGGAKGEVQLVRLTENSIEVNWSVHELGSELGLASGTAVLVRRFE